MDLYYHGRKKNRKLTIFTLYRVCDQKHNSGNCTIYLQQELDLKQMNRKDTDPREAILKYLTTQIQKLKGQGHDIIVVGDTNSDIHNHKRIEEFLHENEMYNVIQGKHKNPGPATYDRGTKCLDLIAVSNTIKNSSIVKCGYLPFYQGIFSDHRAMYVDINTEDLFQRTLPDTNRQIYKRFTTSQRAKCEKYISQLEKDAMEHKIPQKIDNLKNEIIEYMEKGTGSKDYLIERSQKLSTKMYQLMISNERKIGKLAYSKGYPSSSTLRDSANEMIQIRKKLRYERIQPRKSIERINILQERYEDKKKQNTNKIKETQKN